MGFAHQSGVAEAARVARGISEAISLASLPAELFFGLLLENTVEGDFADPIYHGDKDMGSWKMLGFPGAHADFRADVGKREQVVRAPKSLVQALTEAELN